MNRLTDTVAIVTGASKGIGGEIATALAGAGACVARRGGDRLSTGVL